MITPEMRAEMRRLVLRDGWKIETVARRFGVHHSTVRRALRDDLPPERPRPPTQLEPFKPFIVTRLTEWPALTSVRLLAELKPRGFALSLSQLRRYVLQIRPPRPRRAYLRVEPVVGEQAQVDWGSFGHLRIGSTQRPVSAFLMTLSWSRALFVDFSLDQQMDTFLRMHRKALEFFGGVPKTIVYDNLKSAVLHHVGATVQFNPRLMAFAGKYLFDPVAAPPKYPEFKGGVESGVKYVRHSFWYGRTFSSLDDIRAQAVQWRDLVANERLHAATRERPCARLLVERPRLHALPPHPFDTDLVLPLIANKEARVRFDTNTYSVPPECVGKTVILRADDHRVRLLLDGVQVAAHDRCWDRHRHVEDPAHIEKLLERRRGARGPKRRERLTGLCPEAPLYLKEIARRRLHLSHEIDKLLRLVDRYGEAEVGAAIARAIVTQSFGARFVRALCDQARFARGLPEPPEPIVTGNAAADDLVVQPHAMETYDALFDRQDPAASHHDPDDE